MIVLKSQEFVHSFINSTPVQAVINQGLSLGWKLGPGDFRSFGFVVVQLLSCVQIFCDPKDCTQHIPELGTGARADQQHLCCRDQLHTHGSCAEDWYQLH